MNTVLIVLVVLALMTVVAGIVAFVSRRRNAGTKPPFADLSREDQAALLESRRGRGRLVGGNESAKAQAGFHHHNHGAGGL